MNSPPAGWTGLPRWTTVDPSALRRRWEDGQERLMRLAVPLLALLALAKLGDEFRRLLWESGRGGAIDLKLFHGWVHHWFSGQPVYVGPVGAAFPPASFAMLWPLLGWLEIGPARWLWAATSVAALAWLAYLLVRGSGADTRREVAFVALLPLSMNATGVTIGNGQLSLHLLPPLLAGLLLLQRGPTRWSRDLLAAALLLVPLMKPTLSLPFYWLVLFLTGRLRPMVLVASGYLALTLFSASFQDTPLSSLLLAFLANGSALADRGYGNLHQWLFFLGVPQGILPASLLTWIALGLWTYRNRRADPWLPIAVAALVARFWTYHRVYDDLLILLPMIALLRIARGGPSANGSDVMAGALLAVTLLAMLIPASLLQLPPPWNLPFTGGHALVWLLVLAFLLRRADDGGRERQSPVEEGAVVGKASVLP